MMKLIALLLLCFLAGASTAWAGEGDNHDGLPDIGDEGIVVTEVAR